MDLAQKVVEIFSKTPEFKAAELEAKETAETERQGAVDRLGAIEREVIEALVEPLKVLKKLTSETLKAQEAFLSKQRELNGAKIVEQNIRARSDAERSRVEQQLKDGAVPGLAEFVSEASELWPVERHKWTWSAPTLPDGTRMPARRRIDQIDSIRARAVALYFEPNAEKAAAELERLQVEIAEPPAAAVA